MRDAAHYEAFSPHPAPRPALAVFSFLVAQSEMAGVPAPRSYLEVLANPPTEIVKEPTTAAYCSDDRWVADCPFGCGAAELVHPEDKVFLCYNCFNAPVGSALVKVVWPSAKNFDRIVAALERRPPQFRHWFTNEAPKKLENENVENGLLS